MSTNLSKYPLSQAMIDGLRPDLQYQIALANLLSKNQPTETTTRLGDKVMHESFEPKTNEKPTENQETPVEEVKRGRGRKPAAKKAEGTAKKPQIDYRLFRFRDGKVRLLDMVIDGNQGWAVDLWDAVEDEF